MDPVFSETNSLGLEGDTILRSRRVSEVHALDRIGIYMLGAIS